MLTVVFVLLPLGFGGAIWRSYRRERTRAAEGESYSRPGAIRWSGDDHS